MTVGSLFAGIGGIDLGFLQNGFKIKWALDFDSYCCYTLKHNFTKHGTDIINADITKVETLEKVDIITAGFPCQPFSIAGKQLGFEDKRRGNMFFQVMRFVDLIKPKIIFLENVKNLIGHDKGNTLKVIRKEIEKRNYTFYLYIYNTKIHGGLPQNRERVFIVCFNKNVYDVDDTWYEKLKLDEIEMKPLRDFLEDKVDEKYYLKETHHVYQEMIKQDVERYRLYNYRRGRTRENLLRTLKGNVCQCLTASAGMGGGHVPYFRDNNDRIRKLTEIESLRLQGYPLDFEFPNDLAVTQRYKQVGNSVSVPVVSRIVKKIKNLID